MKFTSFYDISHLACKFAVCFCNLTFLTGPYTERNRPSERDLVKCNQSKNNFESVQPAVHGLHSVQQQILKILFKTLG